MAGRINIFRRLVAAILLLAVVSGTLAASGRFDPLPKDEGFVVPGRTAPTAGQDEDAGLDRWLSRDRWHGESFGVSFRIPQDARTRSFVTDGLVYRMDMPRLDAVVMVYMIDTEAMTNVSQLQEVIIERMMVQPSARITEQRVFRVGSLPASVVRFWVPRPGKRPAIMSRAFVQIDARNFISFQLDYDDDGVRTEEIQGMFDAVVRSVRIGSPAQLDRDRVAFASAGDTFRQTLTVERIRSLGVPVSYFRVLSGDRDVGYARVRFEPQAREMGLRGVRRIEEQRLLAGDDHVLDLMQISFLSEDRQHETWLLREGYRPRGEDPMFLLRPLEEPTAASNGEAAERPARRVPGLRMVTNDQGSRSRDLISIARLSAAAHIADEGSRFPVIPVDQPMEERAWETPPQAYLSMLERQMLGPLLPRENRLVVGTYSYQPGMGRVVFRTDRVEPRSDGGFEVWSRVTLNHAERRSVYDAAGRLQDRDLGNGLRMVATDLETLHRIWQVGNGGGRTGGRR